MDERSDATILLHRLRVPAARREALARAGVQVHALRSVSRLLRHVEEAAGPVAVIIDLSSGSQAPERIARAVGAEASVHLVAASLDPHRHASRARLLGFDKVFQFPEGALAEALRHLTPSARLMRAEERALMSESFERESEEELSGRLVNLSATGLCFLSYDPVEPGTPLSFEFEDPSSGASLELRGEVRWCRRDGVRARFLCGLRFFAMPSELRARVDEYVHQLNAIDVGCAPMDAREKVRVQRVGHTRVDYCDLVGDVDRSALLIPRANFILDAPDGARLTARPSRGGPTLQLVVEGVEQTDTHGGSRVALRVRRATA